MALPVTIRKAITFNGTTVGGLGISANVFTVTGKVRLLWAGGPDITTALECSDPTNVRLRYVIDNGGGTLHVLGSTEGWDFTGNTGFLLFDTDEIQWRIAPNLLAPEDVGLLLRETTIFFEVEDVSGGAAVTAGAMEFYLVYEPVSADGSISRDSADTDLADLVESAVSVGLDASSLGDVATAVDALQAGLFLVSSDAVGATGNDSTHIHLPSVDQADNELVGYLLGYSSDDSGEEHFRWITEWDTDAKLATLHAALPETPTDNDSFWILGIRRDSGLTAAETRSALGMSAADLDTQLDALATGIADIPTGSEMVTLFAAADDAILSAIAGLNDLSAEDVWAHATRTLSALGFTLGASDLAADTIGASELAADAITEIVNGVWTTALTEAYNADGAAPTGAQALFVIMQRLVDFAISGTTITVKNIDGTTTAFTLTLDDADAPTSSTRAS